MRFANHTNRDLREHYRRLVVDKCRHYPLRGILNGVNLRARRS